MWYLLWIPVIFSAGFGVGAWWAARPDDVCHDCKASFAATIRGLEDRIHGLKSTNGRLVKEVQDVQFLRTGVRAR